MASPPTALAVVSFQIEVDRKLRDLLLCDRQKVFWVLQKLGQHLADKLHLGRLIQASVSWVQVLCERSSTLPPCLSIWHRRKDPFPTHPDHEVMSEGHNFEGVYDMTRTIRLPL